jgi:hypothetical protein
LPVVVPLPPLALLLPLPFALRLLLLLLLSLRLLLCGVGAFEEAFASVAAAAGAAEAEGFCCAARAACFAGTRLAAALPVEGCVSFFSHCRWPQTACSWLTTPAHKQQQREGGSGVGKWPPKCCVCDPAQADFSAAVPML